MECVGADSAVMKLTYKIIGHQTGDLIEILRRFALEIGVDHIAYVRMGSNKSLESSLFASYVTYPKEWQRNYPPPCHERRSLNPWVDGPH